MEIAYALVFTLAVILNYIDPSSQFECLPNGDPIPDVPRRQPFHSSQRKHSNERPLTPAGNLLRDRTRSPPTSDHTIGNKTGSSSLSEPNRRARSRSPPAPSRCLTPPTTLLCSDRITYGLEQLQFFRLVPYMNPDRLFKLRRYTFSMDQPIKIALKSCKAFGPMPTQEQIVLSTFDGDVFAILENSKFLAGIYKHSPRIQSRARAKINIESGMITSLTKNEIKEVPVGNKCPIIMSFRVEPVRLHNV